MVGSSYAAITQIRTALEAPPHLTAIWPDVAPTNMLPAPDARGRRDAAAHVLGALHPRRRRAGRAGRPGASRRRSGTTCATCGSSSGSWPWHKGELALRHVPALDETLENYCTRGAYDEWWARKENDFTRFWAEHADIPATMSTGWYDGFPHADTEYFAAMAAKNTAPQRLVVGPWSHVGMRGDATYTLDVDFGADSRWGVQRYFEEQLEFFDRWLPDDATGPAGRRGAGADLRDGRRQRPQDRARASSTTAAAGATSRSGRSRARVPTTWHLHGDGSLATEPPAAGRAARTSPTTRRTRCRRSAASTARSASSRRRARGWSRCGRGSSTRRSGCATS